MSVQQLQEKSNYSIISLKEIETKFGKTFIMTDGELNEYWANKKICDFIKKNKIPINNDEDKILFKIKTGEYKTFRNQDGKEISFLNLICSKK